MADQEMELTKVSVEAKMRFLLDAAQITKNMDPTQAFDLIKDIDNEVGLWALTVLLARHFDDQLLLAATHAPELLAMTNDELIAELFSEDEEEAPVESPVGILMVPQ